MVTMDRFTWFCLWNHIDKERFRYFIWRNYAGMRAAFENEEILEFIWRDFLVRHYLDKGVLWAMINQIGEYNE